MSISSIGKLPDKLYTRFQRLWRHGHNVFYGDDYERNDGRCRLGPEWLVLVINNFCNPCARSLL